MISFDKKGFVIYNSFKLKITQEVIQDLKLYGIDPFIYLEREYLNTLCYIRDEKINKILND